MSRYLITGASGFVAQHFLELLGKVEQDVDVLRTDKNPSPHPNIGEFVSIDLINPAEVAALIDDFKPDRIVHLASYSSVASSWVEPSISFANNTNIFLNILEAVRKQAKACRILSIGSSEEYGDVDPSALPLREDSPLNPISPYAVARVAQGSLSRIYARSFGLDIVITRSFNHIGPGQRKDFVVPSLISQFLESRDSEVALAVGEVAVVRDFLDVRDVVKAYLLLLDKGKSGEVYNVCRGKGISIAEVAEMVSHVTGRAFHFVVDDSKIRPNDNRVIIGENAKLRADTGWEPEFDLLQSIRDCCIAMGWRR